MPNLDVLFAKVVGKANSSTAMHIMIFQHADVEHPGVFRHFLAEDGHTTTTVHWNQGDDAPSLDDADALWVLGGPMDVWQENEHPWLVAEKALIREAVEDRGLPYLGLCLGHQLLAEALGGECKPSTEPEIGIYDVQLTEVGASGVLLDGLNDTFQTLQWHSAEITRLPEGATVLATSPACAVQAMAWGPRAHSLQFHVEVEADTVDNWAAIPAYGDALIHALGPDGVTVMRDGCANNLTSFQQSAERLYINWLQTAASTA